LHKAVSALIFPIFCRILGNCNQHWAFLAKLQCAEISPGQKQQSRNHLVYLWSATQVSGKGQVRGNGGSTTVPKITVNSNAKATCQWPLRRPNVNANTTNFPRRSEERLCHAVHSNMATWLDIVALAAVCCLGFWLLICGYYTEKILSIRYYQIQK